MFQFSTSFDRKCKLFCVRKLLEKSKIYFIKSHYWLWFSFFFFISNFNAHCYLLWRNSIIAAIVLSFSCWLTYHSWNGISQIYSNICCQRCLLRVHAIDLLRSHFTSLIERHCICASSVCVCVLCGVLHIFRKPMCSTCIHQLRFCSCNCYVSWNWSMLRWLQAISRLTYVCLLYRFFHCITTFYRKLKYLCMSLGKKKANSKTER